MVFYSINYIVCLNYLQKELACKVIFSAPEGKSPTQTVLGGLYKKEEILVL